MSQGRVSARKVTLKKHQRPWTRQQCQILRSGHWPSQGRRHSWAGILEPYRRCDDYPWEGWDFRSVEAGVQRGVVPYDQGTLSGA